MPHSTIIDSVTRSEMEDVVIPDAPQGDNGEDSEDFGEGDGSYDVIMNSNEAIGSPTKPDIKLEDIFNDEDGEDDEFSNSVAATNVKVESSPPPLPP